jgi:two-component system, sensor histidine kinase PdtaS
VGLPPEFSGVKSDRLGLQIVNTLVSAELGGTVEFRRASDTEPGAAGTEAELRLPLAPRKSRSS